MFLNFVEESPDEPFKYHFEIMNILTIVAGVFIFFINFKEDWKR